jgi:hemerythrin-like domain-containing protein
MAESKDMVMIHRVFRRELRAAPDLIRSVPPSDTDRAHIVGEHVLDLLDVLHHHHEGEDTLLWPKLRERVPERADLFDKMDADHVEVDAVVRRLAADLAVFAASADPETGDEIALLTQALLPALCDHLDREELQVLPLVEEHLTPDEWGELGQRAFGLLPPEKAMLVLGAMAEETPASEWEWFMDHLPPFVQQAYIEVGEQSYRDYIATIRTTY